MSNEMPSKWHMTFKNRVFVSIKFVFRNFRNVCLYVLLFLRDCMFIFGSLRSNVTILETKEGIFTKKVGCFRFYAVSAMFQPPNGSAEKASATLHKLPKEVYSRRALTRSIIPKSWMSASYMYTRVCSDHNRDCARATSCVIRRSLLLYPL